jgi:HK97 family phage prohead protease
MSELEVVEPMIFRATRLEDVELSGSDGRTVVARLMRWDSPSRVTDNGRDFYDEVWRKGVFASSIRRAEKAGRRWPLMAMHQDRLLPVGATTAVHERADGAYFTGKISRTQMGDEIIELINDGALPGVSVGAKPIRSRRTAQLVERVEAAIREISFTPFAALDGAEILALRSMTIQHEDDDPEAPEQEAVVPGAKEATLAFLASLKNDD